MADEEVTAATKQSGGLIFVIAVYLIALTAVGLYAMIALWPYPTPAGEPPPPKTDTMKSETAETKTPTTETPKTATPKTETPKTETPKTETPKTETQKTETQKTETPKTETQKTETTSTAAKPATVKDAVPFPEEKDIKLRQERLCGPESTDTANCRKCIEREMQLQYESQRRFDPQCVRILGCHVLIWQEKRLLLLVLLAGAIGTLLQRLRYLTFWVGNREFRGSWSAYYFLSPFVGASIALVSYVVIRGGFFSSTTTTADANSFMFVALAALSGLFNLQVLAKLEKIAETVFEHAKEGGLSTTATGLAITCLAPAVVKVQFNGTVTVEGTGFVNDSKVHAGGTAMTTTYANEKKLTFVLPATSTATAGKIDVVVVNPSGATSAPKQIEVTA